MASITDSQSNSAPPENNSPVAPPPPSQPTSPPSLPPQSPPPQPPPSPLSPQSETAAAPPPPESSSDTFIVKSETTKGFQTPQLTGKLKLALPTAIVVFLLVIGWVGASRIIKENQAPKRAALGSICQYCENCESSSSKFHQCSGSLQNDVCKYDPSVTTNCTLCKACGDGACDPCEDTSICPQDCISTNQNCPSSKQPGMGGFTNPNPDCETAGGAFCHDATKAYCCYDQNGNSADKFEYCAEGQQGNCKDLGNGSICVKNGWSGTIFKIVGGNNVSCPFYGPDTPVFSGTVSGGNSDCGGFIGQTFSLGVNECGQIDGPCGSCRPGSFCSAPPSPTSTPTPTRVVFSPTPVLPPNEILCNTISLNCSPVGAMVGDNITFTINGDATTWVGDIWTPAGRITGNNCGCTTVSDTGNSCGFPSTSSKTCQATQTGTYTWTHYWKHCEGSTNNCSAQCSASVICGIGTIPPSPTTLSPTPTPTNTPIPTVTNTPIPTPTTAPYCACALARIYDLSWNYIDPSTVKFGTSYYFAVSASNISVQSARFRINQTASTSWCGSSGNPERIISGWCETTTKKPNSNEYYIKYQIPGVGGNFSVQAEVACPTGWK